MKRGPAPPAGRGRSRPAGRRDGPGRARLGAAPRPDARPHRAAHPLRRDLARLPRARHRRLDGRRAGAHGLRAQRMSADFAAEIEAEGQRRDRGRAADPGRLLPRDQAFQIPDLIRTRINLLPPGDRPRSAPSRSSGSTCRPTAARTSPTPVTSAGSGSSATSRRGRSTSGSGSRSRARDRSRPRPSAASAPPRPD